MPTATYSVIVIREGRMKDFVDFWYHGLILNSTTGERLYPELVGFAETATADSKLEAESIVRLRHPECLIDTEATQCVIA